MQHEGRGLKAYRHGEDDRASRSDDENPEWMREEIRNARPALEAIAEAFGATAAERLRRGRDRPPKADRKVSQNLRLVPSAQKQLQG